MNMLDREILNQAIDAAIDAATEKLNELKNAGPKWAVKDGNQTVGTMLDLCGFAWVTGIKGNSPFVRQFKKIASYNEFGGFSYKQIRLSKAYGGGMDLRFPDLMRQEVSVKIAANKAGLKVLQDAGWIQEAFVVDRLD